MPHSSTDDCSISYIHPTHQCDDEISFDGNASKFSAGYSTVVDHSDLDHHKLQYASPRNYMNPVVAEKEQKAVFMSRIVMILVIISAMTALSAITYHQIKDSEEKEFESQFHNYASEVTAISRQNARTMVDTVQAFSSTVTSYAEAVNGTWPFVRIPHFHSRASQISKLINAIGVSVSPIVHEVDRERWRTFLRGELPSWYEEAIAFEGYQNVTSQQLTARTLNDIFQVNFSTLAVAIEDRPSPWLLYWQSLPTLQGGRAVTNMNILSGPRANLTFQSAYLTGLPALDFVMIPLLDGSGVFVPESQMMQPIFERVDEDDVQNRRVVGMVFARFDWVTYFQNLLPVDVNGLILVLESTCEKDNEFGSSVFTYQINGLDAIPLGVGDQHDPQYDYLKVMAPFVSLNTTAVDNLPTNICIPELIMTMYPSKEFEDSFYGKDAQKYTLGVIFIFAFTSFVFAIYDFSVRLRQSTVMARVIRQDKIVSDMFPTTFRDKLYAISTNHHHRSSSSGLDYGHELENGGGGGGPSGALAELYPSVTVVFADVCGFTAWSSAREPYQVFELLESLYGAFDKLAYRNNVFKVESVGDCYVAVGGLPEAREDHAVIVAQFARDCLFKMAFLTKTLEVALGPDTADLQLRLGIHTGQVTAGILRGERSRFQLFGDTVNTASLLESTARRGHIQISSITAKALETAGYSRWIQPREDKVSIKGKGQMQTYWLQPKGQLSRQKKESSMEDVEKTSLIQASSGKPYDDENDSDIDDENDKLLNMTKTERLVEWHVEVLGQLLQQVITARGHRNHPRWVHSSTNNIATQLAQMETSFIHSTKTSNNDGSLPTVLDEFKEIICLPSVTDEELLKRKQRTADGTVAPLSPVVVSELRSFVSVVASMYRQNSFHNFEHASHVTSSVRKLLTRIVNASATTTSSATTTPLSGQQQQQPQIQLVDRAGHSFGITSDPLTQFAVVFSAIIHDADHPGVPNAQLVKENTQQALRYKKKSVAEQNSVDLVWSVLMKDDYRNLRGCIYSNPDELQRFRQLVVNTVMATDIVDKELQALRKVRWEIAFSTRPSDASSSMEEHDNNRKATIVIEHLIQASDVAHTMQHWHIYRRWNERFFMECYGAYKTGRSEEDPSVGWYKGEIGFFDFYVIPLAKKLESCGVFGVSSYEYLNYAMSNREEWVREGEGMVEEYLLKFEQNEKIGTNRETQEYDDEDVTETDLSVSLGSSALSV